MQRVISETSLSRLSTALVLTQKQPRNKAMPHATWWWIICQWPGSAFALLWENVTSSTKLEAHNLLYCCQSREGLSHGHRYHVQKFFGHIVFEIMWADKPTYSHEDSNVTALLGWGEVIKHCETALLTRQLYTSWLSPWFCPLVSHVEYMPH